MWGPSRSAWMVQAKHVVMATECVVRCGVRITPHGTPCSGLRSQQSCSVMWVKGHRWGSSPRTVTSVKKAPLAGRLLSVGCAVTQAAREGPSCSQTEVGRPCQSPRTWPSCHCPCPEKRRKVVFDLCERVEVSLRVEILGSLLPHTSLKPSHQARRSFSHLLFTLRYSYWHHIFPNGD